MIQAAKNDLLLVSVSPCTRITVWEAFQQHIPNPIFNQSFTQIGQEKSTKIRRSAGICYVTRNRAEFVSVPFSAALIFWWPHTNGSNQLAKGCQFKMFALCIPLRITCNFQCPFSPSHLKAKRMLKKRIISFLFSPFCFLTNFNFPLAEHSYWGVLCNVSAADMEASLLCLECQFGHLF